MQESVGGLNAFVPGSFDVVVLDVRVEPMDGLTVTLEDDESRDR